MPPSSSWMDYSRRKSILGNQGNRDAKQSCDEGGFSILILFGCDLGKASRTGMEVPL